MIWYLLGSEYIYLSSTCFSLQISWEVLETCNVGIFCCVSCNAGHACVINCHFYWKIHVTVGILMFFIEVFVFIWYPLTKLPKLSYSTVWKYLFKGELDLFQYIAILEDWEYLVMGPIPACWSTFMLLLLAIIHKLLLLREREREKFCCYLSAQPNKLLPPCRNKTSVPSRLLGKSW